MMKLTTMWCWDPDQPDMAPRLLIPCRNSGRRPDQQLEPPAPPGPKTRGQRPVLDL